MAVVLIAVLGLYAIVDSLTVGLGAEQRIAYGALICVTGLILFVTKRQPVRARHLGWIVFCWWAVAGIGLATALILVLVLLGALYPSWLASRRDPADALRYE